MRPDSRSPADEPRAPREAAAERREEDQVALLERLGAIRREARAAARHVDEAGALAVRPDRRRQNAVIRLRGLDERRAGAVAEEDARRAVGVVAVARQELGPDQEDVLRLPR